MSEDIRNYITHKVHTRTWELWVRVNQTHMMHVQQIYPARYTCDPPLHSSADTGVLHVATVY